MSETNQEKLLLKIIDRLDEMSSSLNELNTRVNRLEGKTDDIHRFTPFVGWLETVGQTVSKKWFWLKGVPDAPQITNKSKESDTIIPKRSAQEVIESVLVVDDESVDDERVKGGSEFYERGHQSDLLTDVQDEYGQRDHVQKKAQGECDSNCVELHGDL